MPTGNLRRYREEINELTAVNAQLRNQYAEQQEELEEHQAMVEMLKSQVNTQMGLVSDPRSSPFIGPALSL